MAEIVLAVIGGTGLYAVNELKDVEAITVDTPFGKTSAPIVIGRFGDTKILFLARHGRNHNLLPSEINYRANIWALKKLGATWCLSVSAVGSLKEEMAPGHVVVPDQFIDRTRERKNTFFGDGVVAHVPFATPICPAFSKLVYESSRELCNNYGTQAHSGGTYLAMEGPAFSTRAESRMYCQWGASVIGMTNLPEAKLAREAEMSYVTLAMVTDYDCWRSDTDDVDVSDIIKTLQANTLLAKKIVCKVAEQIHNIEQPHFIKEALSNSIITPKENITPEAFERLALLINKYM